MISFADVWHTLNPKSAMHLVIHFNRPWLEAGQTAGVVWRFEPLPWFPVCPMRKPRPANGFATDAGDQLMIKPQIIWQAFPE